jgi:hypothetical protein
MESNANMSADVVARALGIAIVGLRANVPQVSQSVVGANAILVIDIARRVISVDELPDKPMP